MNRIKRIFYIFLANLLLSATVTAAILYFWERNQKQPQAQVTVVLMVNPTIDTAVALGTPITVFLTETVPSEPDLPEETPISPEPTRVIEYRVKTGDTLSNIAFEFDASIDDIMRLNGITDPNLISVGETLFIPTGPLPTYTPVPTTPAPPSATSRPVTPTISLTPTPSPSGNPVKPIIEGVIAAGNLADERVRITRIGLGELNLAGWQIDDGDGHTYIFPRMSLFEGGGIFLHTTQGLDTATNLYWGLSQPAWQSGEVILLRDAQGDERARYNVP